MCVVECMCLLYMCTCVTICVYVVVVVCDDVSMCVTVHVQLCVMVCVMGCVMICVYNNANVVVCGCSMTVCNGVGDVANGPVPYIATASIFSIKPADCEYT